MGEVLIDTNVLVCAVDGSDTAKSAHARELLTRLRAEGTGVVSQQSLSEFARVATGRIPEPLSAAEAAQWVSGFAESFRVVPVTPLVVIEALRVMEEHALSFWDAQIIAAGELGVIRRLYSEDFADGREYGSVTVTDPFASPAKADV